MTQPDGRSEEVRRRDAASANLGIVYFILFGNRIKIGWTQHLRRRITALPQEEILGIINGSMANEAHLHRYFRAHLVAGREWFEDCPEIRSYITKYCRQPSLGQTYRGNPRPFWNKEAEDRRLRIKGRAKLLRPERDEDGRIAG